MIGVFDSGSGGLTVVQALRRFAPNVDILYFGDTAHVPYGTKTDPEIQRLTLGMLGFLRRHGAATIVSACNSISAAVIRPFFDLFGVRDASLTEMVGPAIEELARQQVREAALLATPATVRSGMYERLAAERGIRLTDVVCPTLAKEIEDDDEHAAYASIETALRALPLSVTDVLLGCTHYPLLRNTFGAVATRSGRLLRFIDPAEVVAAAAIRQHGPQGAGWLRIVCSERSPGFCRRVEALLGVRREAIEVHTLPEELVLGEGFSS